MRLTATTALVVTFCHTGIRLKKFTNAERATAADNTSRVASTTFPTPEKVEKGIRVSISLYI
jgi:hypothetical protein